MIDDAAKKGFSLPTDPARPMFKYVAAKNEELLPLISSIIARV
jgi:hypothetical protein